MPRAICEDCGSLVEAELTHNGVGRVVHYVHCGWGHVLSPDDLISDDVAQIIADLEAKLAKAVKAIEARIHWSAGGLYCNCWKCDPLVTTLAEIKGKSHE